MSADKQQKQQQQQQQQQQQGAPTAPAPTPSQPLYPAMAPPPGQAGMYAPPPQPGGKFGVPPGTPVYAAPGMPPTGAGFAPVGMQPTLVPVSALPQAPFNVGADCEKLYKAMRGVGTDEAALIEVLAYRTKPQLLEIAATYQRAHSKALADVIKSETSGHFRQLLLELLKPTDELLADIVHEAVHGPGTKDLLLIDVITQTTAQDMAALKATYQRKYKESLQKAVHDDTSGDYRTLLLACVVEVFLPSLFFPIVSLHTIAVASKGTGHRLGLWGTRSRSRPTLNSCTVQASAASAQTRERLFASAHTTRQSICSSSPRHTSASMAKRWRTQYAQRRAATSRTR